MITKYWLQYKLIYEKAHAKHLCFLIDFLMSDYKDNASSIRLTTPLPATPFLVLLT